MSVALRGTGVVACVKCTECMEDYSEQEYSKFTEKDTMMT
jgi:hypothetical protein